MMNLEKKIESWVDRNLISKEQADAIIRYEKKVSPNLLTYTLLTLGISIVSLGILAFVAANWEHISGSIKIFLDFLLLMIIAFFIVTFHSQNKPFLRDRAIVFFQLFILISIGLISQVFHTSGKLHEALFLWTAITLPIVLVAENKFPSHILLFTVYSTIYLYLLEHDDMQKRSVIFVVQLLVPSFFFSTGALLQKSEVPSLQRFGYSSLFWGTVAIWVGTLSFHLVNPFEWDTHLALGSVLIFSFSTFLLSLLVYFQKRITALLILMVGILYLGIYILRLKNGSTEVWDAVFFIGIWFVLGLLFLSLRYNRLFEASIVIVGIRFLVVYFQIFESLLMTSLGLVLSGILIVVLVLLYMKYKEKIYATMEKYL